MMFHTSESLPQHLQARFPDATVCLKPISSEVLLSKVKEMVDQRSEAREGGSPSKALHGNGQNDETRRPKADFR